MTDNDCIFCKIVSGEIPSDPVIETKRVIAIKDIKPLAPIHFLIIPKQHIPTLNDLEDDDPLIGEIMSVAKRLARDHGVAEEGYRVMINVNRAGGQVVFHLHVHLLAGTQFD